MSVIKKLALSVALAAASAVGSAQAATIYPVSATASTEYNGYPASDAIDNPGGQYTDWANNSVGAGSTLELNLGALYSLADAYVTDRVTSGGPNNSYVGGLFDYTTEFTLQGFTNSSFTTPDTSLFTVYQSYPAAVALSVYQTSPTPGYYCPVGSLSACFETTVPLGGATSQYWLYTIVSQNDSEGVYNNAGLSDIHFSTTQTPLPSTWSMLIAGFVGLGFFACRGTKKSSVAIAAA